MPFSLIQDENQQPSTSNPAKLLSHYLQDVWAIADPSETDILWDSYWTGKGKISFYFKEYSTRPEPMILGWRKWSYYSDIGIIIAAWYEKNGDYSAAITNARNHIENLIQDDVRAMKDYGISAMRITNFIDEASYPDSEQYKDSTCSLEIRVAFIASKTVVEI
jgi:hypothetical protein